MPEAEAEPQAQAPAQPQDQIEAAYRICKLQAAAEGTFDETLMRHWFSSAWDLCAQMIGLEPPQEIKEPICIDDNGGFTLSRRPTSDVEIFDGYTLIAVLPRTLERTRCDPALCCLCHPYARYMIGAETCEVPERFIQAVARVFAYIVENRGDSLLPGTSTPGQILTESGAIGFLRPDLTFVM